MRHVKGGTKRHKNGISTQQISTFFQWIKPFISFHKSILFFKIMYRMFHHMYIHKCFIRDIDYCALLAKKQFRLPTTTRENSAFSIAIFILCNIALQRELTPSFTKLWNPSVSSWHQVLLLTEKYSIWHSFKY